MNTVKDGKKAFTMVELLIVLTLVVVIATGLIIGNYITSYKKGKDSRRKSDLQNIQKALELYYEDNRAYPLTLTWGVSFCHPLGCNTAKYMDYLPNDSSPGFSYYYQSTDGTYYKLYSCIENDNDRGPAVRYQPTPAYSNNCGGSCSVGCRFGVSSTNATP